MKKSVMLRIGLTASCFLLLPGCFTRSAKLRMAVEVASDPEAAQVSYAGRNVGTAPTQLNVDDFQDLLKIAAKQENRPLLERRVRILSPSKAQLTFRFGDEVSPVAKALGLSKILIFDYSENVSFDSDKHDLKTDALTVLDKQAEILATYFPGIDVYVCGHTDSTGSESHNLDLSLERAKVVADALTARGVPAARVKVQGFGKVYPIAPNDTPQGRATNRRTELVLPQ